MPDDRGTPDLVHGVPPIAVSSTSTLGNRTGSWKYIKPIYQDKIAPCNAACPVGIDIEGTLNLLREDRIEEARDLFLRENPLPGVTGRVCQHPCQGACNRAYFDEAVNIHAIERWLGDYEAAFHGNGNGNGDSAAAPTRRERVAVVGAGPAGLACAYHLARLGYGVTVFEADGEPGGTLRWDVPEYKLPREVLVREIDRIRRAGVTIHCNTRIGREMTWTELAEGYQAVFVAAGARRRLPVQIVGMNGCDDVRAGHDFLRELKEIAAAGAAAPAETLGRLAGRRVVVLGGTDLAIDCARSAVRLGARVTLVFPGARNDLAASGDSVREAIREGVRFEFEAWPVRLYTTQDPAETPAHEAVHVAAEQGDGYGGHARLLGVECIRRRGAEAPPAEPETDFVLQADLMLTALEEVADLDALPADLKRRANELVVNEFGATSRSGWFAGGEVTAPSSTVATAIGMGKRAAIGIDRYLRAEAGEEVPALDAAALRYAKNGNMSITRWRGDDPVFRTNELNELVTFDMLKMAHFKEAASYKDRLVPLEKRSGFGETNLGLAPEDALLEAKRCFNCGVCNMCELCLIFCPDVAIKRHPAGEHGFSLSYKYCKGCGICVEECPRGAMSMTREGL